MADNILLLDIDGTQTLPIAKPLFKRGSVLWGFYNEKKSYGYHTRYIRHKILSPSAHDDKNYTNFLKEFLGKHKIDIVIPLSDRTAEVLSKHKTELLPLTNYIIPDYDVFMRGYDKNMLMELCRDNGFPHPRTLNLESEIGKIDDSIFPSLIKPNITTGGRGMVKVNNREEFEHVYPGIREKYGECHLQHFIEPGGRQIKVQLFMDGESNPLFSSVIHKQRFYPVNGGSSCFCTSIDDDGLAKLCGDVLRRIGWVGFADFDLIEDPEDGVIKIMEINPRVPACIKCAVKSGIDYGAVIADATLGREPGLYTYRPGTKLRHIGFETLWLLKSQNRWKARPSIFRVFGKSLYSQDFEWSDPMPFLFGTWGNIKKLFNPEVRKAKSGIK